MVSGGTCTDWPQPGMPSVAADIKRPMFRTASDGVDGDLAFPVVSFNCTIGSAIPIWNIKLRISG
jgi:hypothetical protein